MMKQEAIRRKKSHYTERTNFFLKKKKKNKNKERSCKAYFTQVVAPVANAMAVHGSYTTYSACPLQFSTLHPLG